MFIVFITQALVLYGDAIHTSLSLKQIDPSAGSPTETLLRLLLPLNATIRIAVITILILSFNR